MSANATGGSRALGAVTTPGGVPMQRQVPSDDSSSRRAQRKRVRLSAKPPERSGAYDHMTVDDMRQLRQQLTEEEGRVSYWRRIVQAKLDIMRDGSPRSGATIEGLNRVLSEHIGMPRRIAYLPVQPVEGAAPLPELPWLWQHLAHPGSGDNDALAAALNAAEVELSTYRGELHGQIDAVTGQLIARYREDPSMALTALPTRSSGLHRL